jgi:GxxExxY protein
MPIPKVNKELVEPELSYKIVGVLFTVFKAIGAGFEEKHYQRALAEEFKKAKIKFAEQVRLPLNYGGTSIGSFALDFLVEDKIILEIKKDKNFGQKNIDQVYSYLKATSLKLGILANFTKDGLKFKRIVNLT